MSYSGSDGQLMRYFPTDVPWFSKGSSGYKKKTGLVRKYEIDGWEISVVLVNRSRRLYLLAATKDGRKWVWYQKKVSDVRLPAIKRIVKDKLAQATLLEFALDVHDAPQSA